MAEQSEIKRGRGWGRPFVKGQSGNPKGRPKGRRKSPSYLAKTLLEREAEAIMGKIVAMAMRGDVACLKLCLDRLLPMKKESPIEPGLPRIGAADDVPRFFAATIARLEEGLLTTSDAKALKELAESYRRLIEMVDLGPRVAELEAIADSQQK